MDLSTDLPLFYADWPAVDVTWTPKVGQAKTGRAILNEPGTVVLNGEVLSTEFGLRFQTGTFSGVKKGDQFAVGARTFIARENAQPTRDGLEQTVPVARAS